MLFKLNVHGCPADRVLDVIIRDDFDAELADGVLARMREQLLVIRRANAASVVRGPILLESRSLLALLARLRKYRRVCHRLPLPILYALDIGRRLRIRPLALQASWIVVS